MDQKTKDFYDAFWPSNPPILEKTRRYMLDTLTESHAVAALDAGTGHGNCAIVLSEMADTVTAVDISNSCLSLAKANAAHNGRENISFSQQDLQTLDLPDEKFDLVWCWGVAMMAPSPMKVIDNLMRVTAPGGTIYLGLYLKTWLSPVHQGVRHFCRRFMNTPRRKQFVLNFFAWLTNLYSTLKGNVINARDDNTSIQAQVDDWYYPPYKTFYSPNEIIELLEANDFKASLLQGQLGRVKSATIFVVRATKNQG